MILQINSLQSDNLLDKIKSHPFNPGLTIEKTDQIKNGIQVRSRSTARVELSVASLACDALATEIWKEIFKNFILLSEQSNLCTVETEDNLDLMQGLLKVTRTLRKEAFETQKVSSKIPHPLIDQSLILINPTQLHLIPNKVIDSTGRIVFQSYFDTYYILGSFGVPIDTAFLVNPTTLTLHMNVTTRSTDSTYVTVDVAIHPPDSLVGIVHFNDPDDEESEPINDISKSDEGVVNES